MYNWIILIEFRNNSIFYKLEPLTPLFFVYIENAFFYILLDFLHWVFVSIEFDFLRDIGFTVVWVER